MTLGRFLKLLPGRIGQQLTHFNFAAFLMEWQNFWFNDLPVVWLWSSSACGDMPVTTEDLILKERNQVFHLSAEAETKRKEP